MRQLAFAQVVQSTNALREASKKIGGRRESRRGGVLHSWEKRKRTRGTVNREERADERRGEKSDGRVRHGEGTNLVVNIVVCCSWSNTCHSGNEEQMRIFVSFCFRFVRSFQLTLI